MSPPGKVLVNRLTSKFVSKAGGMSHGSLFSLCCGKSKAQSLDADGV